MNEETRESQLKENCVYDGRVVRVRCDDVLLPDGKKSRREVVEHRGGSAVLAVKENKVLLVRQYRYAVGETLWEIPAGKVEKGETFEQTARRELEEEGGLIADELESLGEILPTPGYSSEHIVLFLASKFNKGKINLDEGEFLTSDWIETDAALEMIKNGEIKDGKTVAALLKYVFFKAVKQRRI